MNIKNSLHALLTAALTSLVVLGVPDGHAEIQAPLSGYVIPQTIEPDPFSPSSSMAATSTSTPRTRAMTVMGDSPLPPVPDKTAQRFRQVDAGGSATCGILQGSGKLLCWGRNDLGQATPPPGKYRFVAMGQIHGCAVTEKGLLRCWGAPSAYPTAQQAKGRFLSVAAGDDHTCALRRNKTVVCWGNNDNGELDAPKGKFLQVVARANHSCGITTDHRLQCWGEKSFTGYAQSVQVGVSKIATGTLHACALKKDGFTVCWGNGINGEAQAPADKFIDIVAGDWHTCGLRPDRTAVCWGLDQYGQTQVGMDKYRQIAAGGMQTCGILRGSQQMTCHGSFADTDLLYPQDPNAQARASQADGQVRPQLAFLAFYQGISGLLTAGLVNTGKMVDQKFEKWEGRMVPVQLGLLIVNMFLGWFLPKAEDPSVKILEELKNIQKDIARVESGVNDVKAKLQLTHSAVLQLSCKVQLAEFEEAYNLLNGTSGGKTTGAWASYQKLLESHQTAMTHTISNNKSAALASLNDANEKLAVFRTNYLDNLKDYREKMLDRLVGINGPGAINSCFKSGHEKYKQNFNIKSDNAAIKANAAWAYPFDDRPIYSDVYKIMREAMGMSGSMMLMELDVNFKLAHQGLLEPREDKVPPVNFDPEENAVGFCLLADQRVALKPDHPDYNLRWQSVADICKVNRERIKDNYKRLVKLAESVGGAYSDEQVVISLTAEQMGLPKVSDKERNWLWARNIPVERFKRTQHDSRMNLDIGNVTAHWNRFSATEDMSPFLLTVPYINSNYWTGAEPVFPLTSDASIYYRNHGCWNRHCQERSFGEGVWHSNGQAWEDIHAFRAAMRKEAGIEEPVNSNIPKTAYEDLIDSMSRLEDLMSPACKRNAAGECETRKIAEDQYEPIPGPRLPLFTGLADKVFWMSGKSFTYDVRSKLDIPSDWTNEETKPEIPLKCFIARNINARSDLDLNLQSRKNHQYKEGFFHPTSLFPSSYWRDWDGTSGVYDYPGAAYSTLKLSGKVCSTDEMGAIMIPMGLPTPEPLMDAYRPCNGAVWNGNPPSDAQLCSEFGVVPKDKNYAHSALLGSIVTKARVITNGAFRYDYMVVVKSVDKFAPYTDGYLYHMPVLDVNQRQCKYSMLGDGRRSPTREGDGVPIKSICGEDLDEQIRQTIPRPEYPPIPESEVRLPEGR